MPNTLEQLVDDYGLQIVLETLAGVCALKTEHLEENWNDARGGELWERARKRIAAMADTDAIELVQREYGPTHGPTRRK